MLWINQIQILLINKIRKLILIFKAFFERVKKKTSGCQRVACSSMKTSRCRSSKITIHSISNQPSNHSPLSIVLVLRRCPWTNHSNLISQANHKTLLTSKNRNLLRIRIHLISKILKTRTRHTNLELWNKAI